MKQIRKVQSGTIEYNGKTVPTKIVEVSSFFDHDTDFFFAQEMVKKNTLRIVKPLVTLTFQKENTDSEYWQEGFIYEFTGKSFGLFKTGGVHYIHVVKVDKENTTITTLEKNDLAKVWNHTLTFEKLENGQTKYTDKIVLYAGALTPLFARYLVWFYKVRHRNWNRLLNELKSA